MQQVRKAKRAARSEMIAGKPARNRRSAEQMLVELKQRLREFFVTSLILRSPEQKTLMEVPRVRRERTLLYLARLLCCSA